MSFFSRKNKNVGPTESIGLANPTYVTPTLASPYLATSAPAATNLYNVPIVQNPGLVSGVAASTMTTRTTTTPIVRPAPVVAPMKYATPIPVATEAAAPVVVKKFPAVTAPPIGSSGYVPGSYTYAREEKDTKGKDKRSRRARKYVAPPPGLPYHRGMNSRGMLPIGTTFGSSGWVSTPTLVSGVSPNLGITDADARFAQTSTTTVGQQPFFSNLFVLGNNMLKGIPPSNREILYNIESMKRVLLTESQASYVSPTSSQIIRNLYNILEDIEMFVQQKNTSQQWQQIWLNNYHRLQSGQQGATTTTNIQQQFVQVPVPIQHQNVQNVGSQQFVQLPVSTATTTIAAPSVQIAPTVAGPRSLLGLGRFGFRGAKNKVVGTVFPGESSSKIGHEMSGLMASFRNLSPLLLSSSEFRSLILEVFQFIKTVFSDSTKKYDKHIREDLKKELEEDKDKNIRDDIRETTQKVSSVFSDIRRDIRSGELPVNKEKKEAVLRRFRETLKRLGSNPQFQMAVDHLFELFKQFNIAFKDMGGNFGQLNQHLNSNINTSSPLHDFYRVMGPFVGEQHLNRFFTSFERLSLDLKNDHETKRWFEDFREYVKTSIRQPELIDDENHRHQLNELWDRAKDLSKKWSNNHSLNTSLNEGMRMVRSLKNDPLLRKTLVDFQRLWNDLLLNPQGGFSPMNVLSTLQAFRFLLIPLLLEQLDFIPIPRIERSTRELDFMIDGAAFYGKSILPENVFFQIFSQNSVNLRQIPATNGTEIQFVLTISDFFTTMRNVRFFFRKKTGLVRLTDEGLMDIDLGGGKNFLVLRWSVFNTLGQPLRFQLSQVYCNFDRLKIRFVQARKRGLLNMMTGLFSGVIRKRINRAIETQIANYFAKFDLRLNALASKGWQQRRFRSQQMYQMQQQQMVPQMAPMAYGYPVNAGQQRRGFFANMMSKRRRNTGSPYYYQQQQVQMMPLQSGFGAPSSGLKTRHRHRRGRGLFNRSRGTNTTIAAPATTTAAVAPISTAPILPPPSVATTTVAPTSAMTTTSTSGMTSRGVTGVIEPPTTISVSNAPATIIPAQTPIFSSGTSGGISSTTAVDTGSNMGVVIDRSVGEGARDITKISPANLPSDFSTGSGVLKTEEISVIPPKSTSAST